MNRFIEFFVKLLKMNMNKIHVNYLLPGQAGGQGTWPMTRLQALHRASVPWDHEAWSTNHSKSLTHVVTEIYWYIDIIIVNDQDQLVPEFDWSNVSIVLVSWVSTGSLTERHLMRPITWLGTSANIGLGTDNLDYV